ncbi:hypothetical protein T492DRAFT_1092095 [Pavlovales sp. CCMP2436]|nr:hypothetical protein T492DRAFT_1092095 [Pavlovales sp. CCMP2436]|mmetsp:Transcript_43958/g.108806  ORF Transcript_43958/g.108806 Transcript_43958/m.108806 type:complete len:329 (+) Transcript_43958:142-1128(+)
MLLVASDLDDSPPCTSEVPPSTSHLAKRLWTPAEDEQLLAVVHKFGASRWSLIATHVAHRAGKQCRERWFNHLCPEVKKGEWGTDEDEQLLRAVAELGSQWSIIVKRMHGRTDNAIKNRYNTLSRRARSSAEAPLDITTNNKPRRLASPDGASPAGSRSSGSLGLYISSSGSESAGTLKRACEDSFMLDTEEGLFDGDEMDQDVFGELLEEMLPSPTSASPLFAVPVSLVHGSIDLLLDQLTFAIEPLIFGIPADSTSKQPTHSHSALSQVSLHSTLSPPKRARGGETDVEQMIAALFPNAALSLPEALQISRPPTPSAMLHSLVHAL